MGVSNLDSTLSFPIHHLSVRIPWHDNGWNGTVCNDPVNNTACLKLPRIATHKRDSIEHDLAGQHFRNLDPSVVPPCLLEGTTVMSSHGVVATRDHPYRTGNPELYGHFRPTEIYFPAFSAPALPFRWMLKGTFHGDNGPALRDHYPLDEIDESLEPKLGEFTPDWWQHHSNQRRFLETFWAHVKEDVSLVFFYAKQVPLIDESAGRRVLVGVGRVKSIGQLTEYQYDQPIQSDKLRSVLWERMLGHSIRSNSEDGFFLPYHEALERSADGETFDPAEVVALAPEERFTEFSYGTEHVGDDTAIESLIAMRTSLSRSAELFGADVRKQQEWIEKELSRLWQKRGPFPGLGAVLHGSGVPMGNFIARALEDLAGANESPWSIWESLLDSPTDFLRPPLANCVDETTSLVWKSMSKGRRDYLNILSRIDLTIEQAHVLTTPEGRRAENIQVEDSEFVKNPYLLYETTRWSSTPLPINALDRAIIPSGSMNEKFPLPGSSPIHTPTDRRRLRALTIQELERAAIVGNTLMPRESIIVSLRQRDQRNDHQYDQGEDMRETLVTSDHLRVTEDALFSNQIRVVEMSDGNPAYQLERLGAAGDLIRRTVDRRQRARRHKLAIDWRSTLDEELDDIHKVTAPVTCSEIEFEERARQEKVAALEEISRARVSVLVGSAGTGKTTLLSVLCKPPEIADEGILLLAPTGKARVQMEDVVRRSGHADIRAYTIAQLLIQSGRYDGSTQRYLLTGDSGRHLGRTVVIDECSMLTEEMLAAVIESLEGVDRLILVGDPRQLPPIGAGRPFVDIVARLKPEEFKPDSHRTGRSYAELTIPRRQGERAREDLELAAWFGGEPGPSGDDVFEILTGKKESDTVKVVHWDTHEHLKEILPRVLAETLRFDSKGDEVLQFSTSLGGVLYRNRAYFHPPYFQRRSQSAEPRAWQILSPVRQKTWGIEPLNRFIHHHYKSDLIQAATTIPKGRKRIFLRPQGDQLIVYGDKVINNRNMRLEKWRKWPQNEGYLANGEVGIVVGQMSGRKSSRPPECLEVEFSTQQGSVVKFWPRDFDSEGEASLELAYALTVHKAQGSEFDTVFLVLPESKHMLSRELIYTALTRQKEKLVLLTQGDATHIQSLSSEEFSDTASRLTNLFAAPTPVLVGDRFLEDKLIHRTVRGEAVRSKSEVIIANLLHSKGINYRYEEPLDVGGRIKYPDFTIEDDDVGERYYWEHLGMLSDPEYRQRWNQKLDWLMSHGILPLENGGGPEGTLITTEDTVEGGIDSEVVASLIDELFCV